MLPSLCPSFELKVDVETPDTLYLVVEGYRCSSNPDLGLRVQPRADVGCTRKHGVDYGEVRILCACPYYGKASYLSSHLS